jgi:hypothetical protein
MHVPTFCGIGARTLGMEYMSVSGGVTYICCTEISGSAEMGTAEFIQKDSYL